MKWYKGFKVGDKVKILPAAVSVGVESEDVGKVGVIKNIVLRPSTVYGISVQMPEICIARGYIPSWSVGTSMVELCAKKNEQLLFDFMRS